MNIRFEQQKYDFEQQSSMKENEMIMSLHQKIFEFTESSKVGEIKLYEELQIVDDKLKISEKTLKDLLQELSLKEKKFYQEKKEFLKEIENLSKIIKDLNQYKEKSLESENKIKKMEEDHHQEMKKKIEKISTLEQNKVV